MTAAPLPEQARNLSVDSFRLLAVFFVILLALPYPSLPRDVVAGLRLLGSWVLPFIYITCGYFFAAKSQRLNKMDTAPVLDRLAWMFIVWNLIYLPLFIGNLSGEEFTIWLTSPAFMFAGLHDHLWLIPSLFFGYLFVAFCYRNNALPLLAFTSVIGLALALFSGAYAVFDLGFKLTFDVPRLWLSVPFLYLGVLFFQKGCPHWLMSLALIVAGIALQIFEARFLYDRYGLSAHSHQFLIGAILFGSGMAGLALGNFKPLALPMDWGREYPLGIYLIQPLIGYFLIPRADSISGLAANPLWQIALPVVIFALSLLTLVAVRRFLPAGFYFLLGRRAPAKEIQ